MAGRDLLGAAVDGPRRRAPDRNRHKFLGNRDHPSYDSGQQIEEPAHIQALVEHKRAARAHRGTDRLGHAAPAALQLLEAAAARGHNLGAITAALLRLLERYGATALQAAIGEALARDVPHPNAVRLALVRARGAGPAAAHRAVPQR